MTKWSTRGRRGDALEEIILFSNDYYLKAGIARVDKAATPITAIEIDGKGLITKAFFEKKATVDFYGIVQGLFITFDAKETNQPNFPLKNIHPHQVDYMRDVSKQGGLAFLIVHFKYNDTFFLIPYELLKQYCDAAAKGGRKSIPYQAMIADLQIERNGNGMLHYLNAVNRYIDWKNALDK